jgi:hypothetical protein
VVSTSEKKYWDIKTHGPGGITTGRANQSRSPSPSRGREDE